MVKKLGNGVSLSLVSSVASVCCLIFAFSCDRPVGEGSDANPAVCGDEIEKLGANAACYVCHMGFVKETISKVHLSQGVTCIDCHGLSAGHANDENIGATPPDITFESDQVEKMCLKCHSRHDISVENKSDPICTDCHGSHRLDGSAG